MVEWDFYYAIEFVFEDMVGFVYFCQGESVSYEWCGIKTILFHYFPMTSFVWADAFDDAIGFEIG